MELCGAARPSRPPFPPAARPAPAPAPAAFGGPPRAPPAAPAHGRDMWRRRDPASALDYSNMVHVSGFPTYTQPQDLAHAFIQFGAVRVERLVDGVAALAFSSPAEARAAIQASRAVNIYGEFLTVRQYNKGLEHATNNRQRKEPAKSKQKALTVDPAGLPWTGDFHTQLDALLHAVRLSAADIQRLGALYRDLEAVLQDAWPGCRAIPFGSVTTGLGVKSSDADCFVLLPGGGPAGGAGGAVPRARRLLAQRPRLFADLLAIPRANTPIVKCYHLPTRTHCDVSFKTPLGAQNSKLIGFLLYADPRLIPVAVTLKYYAGVHDLTGTGKLTNYALTMLIIFYLQQRRVIPSVEWLQRNRHDDCIVDFWNTGFMDNHARLPPNQCGASIAELLGGFFEFYTEFDFDKLVVCPYLGRPIPKELFKNSSLLPPEFERYKVNVSTGVTLALRANTAMCVQDPFEQCHNVASPVTTRLSADIRTYFKFAAEVYNKEKPFNCQNFLRTILLEKPKLARGKSSPEYRISLSPAYVNTIADPDWKSIARNVVFLAFETILKVQLKSIPGPQDKNKKDGAENKDAADTQVKDTPVKEQENVDTKKEQENSKKQKPTVKKELDNSTAKSEEANSSTKEEVNSNTKKDAAPGANKEPENIPKKERARPKREKEKYTGSFTRAVWKRKQYAKLFGVMGLKFQEREQKITEEILKFDKNVINSEFQLMITFRDDPRTVMLSVKYISGEPTNYREFGKFMLSTMQQWFMTLLRPHCNPSKRERRRKQKKEKVEEKEAPAAAPLPEKETLDSDDDSAEIIEQPAPSDTDSVSSYEDERIDPNLQPQETDKSQSDDSNPTDANKENVNASNGDDMTKKLSPDKRNDKVIPQNDDDKPDCGDNTQTEGKTEQ